MALDIPTQMTSNSTWLESQTCLSPKPSRLPSSTNILLTMRICRKKKERVSRTTVGLLHMPTWHAPSTLNSTTTKVPTSHQPKLLHSRSPTRELWTGGSCHAYFAYRHHRRWEEAQTVHDNLLVQVERGGEGAAAEECQPSCCCWWII